MCDAMTKLCFLFKLTLELRVQQVAIYRSNCYKNIIEITYLTSMNVFKVRTIVLCFLVSGIFAGWVDPDTDLAYYSTEALTKGDDREYKLVSLPNPLYSSVTM